LNESKKYLYEVRHQRKPPLRAAILIMEQSNAQILRPSVCANVFSIGYEPQKSN